MSNSTTTTATPTAVWPKPHRPANRAVLTARPANTELYGARWDVRVAWVSRG